MRTLMALLPMVVGLVCACAPDTPEEIRAYRERKIAQTKLRLEATQGLLASCDKNGGIKELLDDARGGKGAYDHGTYAVCADGMRTPNYPIR